MSGPWQTTALEPRVEVGRANPPLAANPHGRKPASPDQAVDRSGIHPKQGLDLFSREKRRPFSVRIDRKRLHFSFIHNPYRMPKEVLYGPKRDMNGARV